MPNRFILITGCSGGGKSTLLEELAGRGYTTVSEPGRRVIQEQQAIEGHAFPWGDMEAFARRALKLARDDLVKMRGSDNWVFFDRGVLDAAVALQFVGGTSIKITLGNRLPYSSPVFLAPPWPEIYLQDEERQHDFASAVAEYERLQSALNELEYETSLLPKASVQDRADHVLGMLGNRLRNTR